MGWLSAIGDIAGAVIGGNAQKAAATDAANEQTALQAQAVAAQQAAEAAQRVQIGKAAQYLGGPSQAATALKAQVPFYGAPAGGFGGQQVNGQNALVTAMQGQGSALPAPTYQQPPAAPQAAPQAAPAPQPAAPQYTPGQTTYPAGTPWDVVFGNDWQKSVGSPTSGGNPLVAQYKNGLGQTTTTPPPGSVWANQQGQTSSPTTQPATRNALAFALGGSQ